MFWALGNTSSQTIELGHGDKTYPMLDSYPGLLMLYGIIGSSGQLCDGMMISRVYKEEGEYLTLYKHHWESNVTVWVWHMR